MKKLFYIHKRGRTFLVVCFMLIVSTVTISSIVSADASTEVSADVSTVVNTGVIKTTNTLTESDYTIGSWAEYQAVVKANNSITTGNLQSAIDAATVAITTAKAALVPVSGNLTNYDEATKSSFKSTLTLSKTTEKVAKKVTKKFTKTTTVATDSVRTYSYTEAKNHMGEFVNITGIVVDVVTPKDTTYLNFCSDRKVCEFQVVVFSSDSSSFPNIKQYEGKNITISGLIEEYKGRAQIILKNPDQIKIN